MENRLQQELATDILYCKTWATRNYVYAHLAFISSVLGSFISTVLVTGDTGREILGPLWYKVVTGFFAAIPGVMLLVNNALKFEDRTKWFWRKTRALERLAREVRDTETPNIAEISTRYGEFSEKLEDEWPAFGTSPAQAAKNTPNR